MTSYQATQLALTMADDLARKSNRLKALHRSRNGLYGYCGLWIEEYESVSNRMLQANVQPEKADKYPKRQADEAVREAMPLWLWVTLGQILLKLIWEWWQNREEKELPPISEALYDKDAYEMDQRLGD